MALQVAEWVDRLRPYRRRVRGLLMWRMGAIGGTAGALVGTGLSIVDWVGWLVIPLYWLPLSVGIGILLGIARALTLRVADSALAQLIDQRAGLKDRLQTALEHTDLQHLFDRPLHEDAQNALEQADPRQIFRYRFGRWQGAFVGAVALMLFMHFLPQLLAVALPERREQQKEIQQSAEQLKEVAKPILEEAKKPDADELAKRIAQNVALYNKRAREAKMDKREALLRANQVLEDARRLEQKNTQKMQEAIRSAQTAGEQMKQLAQKQQQQLDSTLRDLQEQMNRLQQQLQSGKDAQGNPLSPQAREQLQNQLNQLRATLNALQNPNTNALQSQQNELERQLQALQRQLQSGKDAQGNPLSPEQQEQLKKQMEQLREQIRALKLSQEAQEFLRKLYNDPAFKEAMQHLQELAKKVQQQQREQDPQQRKLTQEEIEKQIQELERAIEELAKKYKNDEDIRKLAEQIRDQVKQIKELSQCNGACSGLGLGMGQGFGLGAQTGTGAGMGMGRGGAWDKNDYFGQPEQFNQGERQPELKIPMKDRALQESQPLLPTEGDYIDFEAPPTPGSSSIPLNRALPTYQKKAEQALSQQKVPPAERKRVKRYFESLQSGR
ncbi:MAG: hypothetical protein SNJ72_03305 [Fimbriimonadales bacterium]